MSNSAQTNKMQLGQINKGFDVFNSINAIQHGQTGMQRASGLASIIALLAG